MKRINFIRILCIVSSSMVLVLILQIGNVFAEQNATLTLNPASRNIAIGDVFDVDILLDTGGNAVDGVDIHYLNYKPQYLEVQDADPSKAGVQIKAGNLFPNTMTNNVISAQGKIDFSQITSGGSTYTGSGVLATITFKVVGVDTPDVTFDFTPDNTRDTNVAGQGQDILASVFGARFTNSGTVSETPGVNGGATSPAPQPSSGSGYTPPPLTPSTSFTGLPADLPPGSKVVQGPEGKMCIIPVFTTSLFRGSRGLIVEVLQRYFNNNAMEVTSAGPGAPGEETKYYGSLTVDAVKKFQCNNDVVCSGDEVSSGYGVLGPKTRAKLNEVIGASSYMDCSLTMSTTSGFVRDLTIGSRGEDVRRLQQFLNQKGIIVASSGDGSLGQETDYFGSLTKNAVIKYQETYASAILAPVGLVKGSGYFGASTRTHINQSLGQ